MKRILAVLMLLPGLAAAEYKSVQETQQNEYVGPTKDEVALLEVSETPPVGEDRPLSVKVKNNSQYYLDRVAVECDITDDKGYRAFKDIVFKSKPMFSVRMAWPPISTPEMGIPPGTVADIGVYTDDNRWMRGFGKFSYDCKMYGVSGRE